MTYAEECPCKGFVSGPSTSYAFCLDCQHGLYYHADGPCRHSDQPESKIRTMTQVDEAKRRTWFAAAAYLELRVPCLGNRCRIWFRIPEEDRRHNMHCPRFIAYEFRARARGETELS